MTDRDLLIVFVKNLQKGEVKTRLAKAIGDDRAFKVYEELLDYTRSVVSQLSCDKAIYYSKFIDLTDNWPGNRIKRFTQDGSDLGARMSSAFEKAFKTGFERVVIIGSDCLEITATHINNSFLALNDHDFVLGPVHDGGYYLLGMKEPATSIFRNKKWSTDTVLHDTLEDIRNLRKRYFLLETLNDIDEAKDLKNAGAFQYML